MLISQVPLYDHYNRDFPKFVILFFASVFYYVRGKG